MSKVADIGLWDLSTVMQLIKRLREKQLIAIHKNDADLRISYVSLTGKGEEIRELSSGKDHRLLDFLEEYRMKNEESSALLNHFYDFLNEANLYFHGREFVDWVKKAQSSKPM